VNHYYVHSNADLIAALRSHYGIKGDLFWAKLDRAGRTMTDEASGRIYEIPDDWNLT
jgi:hypothetical protein